MLMSRLHLPVRPLALGVTLVLAAALAGCSIPFLATPSVELVSVEVRGGLCPGGPCATTVTLDRDGSVHAAAKPPNDLGTVPGPALAALEAAIRTTDFAALRSHPFSGLCPTAVDGAEVVYTFWAPSGVERVASCEVQVDPGDPLFVAVAAALGSFIALPSG
jgi:hypothetical protein